MHAPFSLYLSVCLAARSVDRYVCSRYSSFFAFRGAGIFFPCAAAKYLNLIYFNWML
jgi:hypothetical protein